MTTDTDIERFLDSPIARSLVSKNADYYIRTWKKIAKDAGFSERVISLTFTMNWSAVFFLIPWAMYRKLYFLVVISSAVWLMLLISEIVTGRHFLVGHLAFSMFLGSMGNSLYLVRTLRDVRDIGAAADPARRQAELLRRRAPDPMLAVVGVVIASAQIGVAGLVLGWFPT